jgi:hypothetical protein
MKNKKEIIEKIAKNLDAVLFEQSFTNYAKNHYSQIENGSTKIAKVLEKTYHLALNAESEQIQLAAIKEIRESITDKDVKQENTQVNIYQNISDQINENVSRLIDVSNKKSKSNIEKII